MNIFPESTLTAFVFKQCSDHSSTQGKDIGQYEEGQKYERAAHPL